MLMAKIPADQNFLTGGINITEPAESAGSQLFPAAGGQFWIGLLCDLDRPFEPVSSAVGGYTLSAAFAAGLPTDASGGTLVPSAPRFAVGVRTLATP
jgi:hypothetical protein